MIFVFEISVKTKIKMVEMPIGKVLAEAKWNFDLKYIDT